MPLFHSLGRTLIFFIRNMCENKRKQIKGFKNTHKYSLVKRPSPFLCNHLIKYDPRNSARHLKETFTPKCKVSHHLLTAVLMGSQVKFRRPQNISGASQQNRVAAFSLTTSSSDIVTRFQTFTSDLHMKGEGIFTNLIKNSTCKSSYLQDKTAAVLYFTVIMN